MLENMQTIRQAFGASADFRTRSFEESGEISASIYYIDGLINAERLEEHVIKPLAIDIHAVLQNANMKATSSTEEAISAIIQGKAVVVYRHSDTMMIADVTMWKERPVGESLTERNPLGLLLGFTEKANTNISILRSLLKTTQFMVETIDKGTLVPTSISMVYMRNIVDKAVLQEVRKRLNGLNVKYVLQSAIVEEVLVQNSKTFFPLTASTEAPDIAASAMLEGKVIVFVDNTPHAIICPALFVSFFQSPEEYYSKYGRLVNRFIKAIAFFTATHASAVFILLDHSHVLSKKVHGLLYPKDILIPSLVQVLILVTLFKILVDGMYKTNKNLVTFFALVSTVLISENMLKIKIFTPLCLCVVALSYVICILFISRGLAAPILTLLCLYSITASLTGPIGVIVLTTLTFVHIAMLKSINVPYLSPLIPFKTKELRDVFFRSNLKKLINSEHSYSRKGKR